MTEIGLAAALRKLKEHDAGRERLGADTAVMCARVIEEHRRWNNTQIQRLADALLMSESHSELVINRALELIAAYREMGEKMIAGKSR